jgi:chromosome segregation ATPase
MHTPRYRIILPFLFLAVLSSGPVSGQQEEGSFREISLEKQLKEAQTKLQERALIVKDLQLEKTMMQDMLMELSADKDRLEKEVYDLLFGDFQSSAKESITARMKKVREPFEEDINTLNKIISSYKMEFQEKEKETDQLLGMVEELEQKLQVAEAANTGLEENIKGLTLQLSDVQKSFEQKKLDLESSVTAKVDAVRVPLEAKIDVLKEQIQANEQDINTQQIKVEEENAKLTEKVESYKAQLQDEGRAVISRESELEKLNEKLSQQKKEIDRDKTVLKSAEAQLEQLTEQLTLFRQKAQDNERAVKTLQREKLALEKKYEELADKHDTTKQYLSSKIKTQEKQVMKVEQQSQNKGAYLDLLKQEVENALDLLSY